MKLSIGLLSFTLLASTAGCVGPGGDDALPGATAQELTNASNSCAWLTSARTQTLLTQVEGALALAEQEIASGNPAGSNPVAAEAARDQLTNARNEVVTLRAWLTTGGGSDSNPAVTNYVEGQAIAGSMDRVTTQLQGASWQLSLRAVYHRQVDATKGTLARQALYGANLANETANNLRHNGYRCNLSAYGL